MKKILPLALEDYIIYLEKAENLINIFEEFVDEECPIIKREDFKEESIKAVIYAERTEQFRTVIEAAFDYISQAKSGLSNLVYEKPQV